MRKNKRVLFFKIALFLGTLALIASIITAFEFYLRKRHSDFLGSKIALLERFTGTNPAYNKALYEGYRGREEEAGRFFKNFARIPSVYRPYIEWRRAPNFHSPGINLNSLSYRGEEFSTEKDEGIFRILVYGGSFVWGTGALTDGETISGNLERLLNETYDDRRYQVINCGESGFNSTQELVFLMVEGIFLNPDMVIFIDGVNDTHLGYKGYPAGYPALFERFNDVLTGNLRRWNEESFTIDNELEYLKKQKELIWEGPYTQIGSRISSLINGGRRENKPDTAKEYTSPSEYAMRHFYNLKTADAIGKELGFSVVGSIQPVPVHFKPLHPQERQILDTLRRGYDVYNMEISWQEKFYNRYAERLTSYCDDSKILLLDLRKIFEGDASPRYLDDCHVTGDGYKIVAETLFDFLSSRGLVGKEKGAQA